MPAAARAYPIPRPSILLLLDQCQRQLECRRYHPGTQLVDTYGNIMNHGAFLLVYYIWSLHLSSTLPSASASASLGHSCRCLNRRNIYLQMENWEYHQQKWEAYEISQFRMPLDPISVRPIGGMRGAPDGMHNRYTQGMVWVKPTRPLA